MATRWPTRTSIGLGIVVMLVCGATASAQELSFSLSLDATIYGGDAYKPTNGDRGGELAIAYQMMRGLKLGGGVFVGKFDEPISDPSFTAVSLFFEPAWVFRRTARVRPFVGSRVAWEHQRAGDRSSGLWAYGWSVAGVAGVLVRLGEPVSVGVRTVVSGLNMDREDQTSRNGLRVQVGGSFILTWVLR